MMIAAVAVSTGFAAEAVASAERRQEEARADSLFEVAVEIIKKYETMHHPRHWPLVGYGHKVLSDDSIYAVPYTSQRELHMLDSLIKADLATLPPDLRKGGWRPVTCFVEADGTQVFRIDRTSAKDGRPIYRMLTYDNFSDLEGQASLNMEGYMEAEGSAMNITYTFWGDDGTTYTLEPEPSDDSDATILISGPSHPDSQISVRPASWLDLVKK